MRDDDDDWRSDRNLVISDLRRLKSEMKEIQKLLLTNSTQLARLEVKSGAWGAIAAITIVVLAALTKYFTGR